MIGKKYVAAHRNAKVNPRSLRKFDEKKRGRGRSPDEAAADKCSRLRSKGGCAERQYPGVSVL
jgi:hypothetical protein